MMMARMNLFDAIGLALLILSPFVAIAIHRLRAARRPCRTPRCSRVAAWTTLDGRQWCHQCLGGHLEAAGLIRGRVQ